MERRGALKTIAAGAAVISASAAPYGFAQLMAPRRALAERNYMRPPGALKDDGGFTAACIGCGLCGEVCPPRCIRFHALDNTPYIDPEEAACILCDKCMEACPTAALNPTPRTSIDMGIAQIDRDACYPWVDKGICGACVSICPLGDAAIDFRMYNQYRPVIKSGCVGCGLCVEVCPHPSTPIWIVERASKPAGKAA